MALTNRAPALAAYLEPGLIAKPQFEAQLSCQRAASSQERRAEIVRAKARLDSQLHEAPNFRDAKRFKGTLSEHVFAYIEVVPVQPVCL
jgi:hypothetical protein